MRRWQPTAIAWCAMRTTSWFYAGARKRPRPRLRSSRNGWRRTAFACIRTRPTSLTAGERAKVSSSLATASPAADAMFARRASPGSKARSGRRRDGRAGKAWRGSSTIRTRCCAAGSATSSTPVRTPSGSWISSCAAGYVPSCASRKSGPASGSPGLITYAGLTPTSRMPGCSPYTRLGNARDIPDEETTDWRAVCGKTARAVRRAGRRKPSRPLSGLFARGPGSRRRLRLLAMTMSGMAFFPKIFPPSIVVHAQGGEEGGLGDFDVAELAHALLPLLLLLQELALAADVAAVALGGHVLAQGRDGLARHHLAADGRLDRDLEELARDQLLQLQAERAAAGLGLTAVDDEGQRIHGLLVHQDGELDQVALLVAVQVIVEGGIAPGHRLQAVVEVE